MNNLKLSITSKSGEEIDRDPGDYYTIEIVNGKDHLIDTFYITEELLQDKEKSLRLLAYRIKEFSDAFLEYSQGKR